LSPCAICDQLYSPIHILLIVTETQPAWPPPAFPYGWKSSMIVPINPQGRWKIRANQL